MNKKEKNPLLSLVGGMTFLFLSIGVLFVAILGDFIGPGKTVVAGKVASFPEVGYKTALFSWSLHWRGLDGSKISIIQMIIMIIALVFCLFAVILALAKKQKSKMLDGVIGFLEIGWASYLLGFFTGITGGLKNLNGKAWLGLIPAIVFIAIAFFFFQLPAVFGLLKKKAAAPAEEPAEEEKAEEEPKEEEPKEEEKAEEPVAEEKPEEEPVEEEKAEEEPAPEEAPEEEAKPEEEPVEEEKAEEPVEEEKPEEEPKEEEPAEEENAPAAAVIAEEEAEEEAEEGEGDDELTKLRALKRVPFVEKLEVADDDIREKFEKLREYILAYGVHERESISGVGFNSGRKRIIFIGFAGKKLKVRYALDLADYEGSKIPVEKDDAKKFETMPVAIRVQSDLSYRRAKKLVDDVMAKAGVEKPENLPEDDIQVEGKYEVYPEAGYFKYRLKANNGQILIVSNSYRSKDGALSGIETLKKNMEVGTHRVVSDKKGFAQFRIFTENDSRLVVAGEIYGNEQGAQKALESALRFYKSEKINVLDEIPEAEVREWRAELSPITALPNGKLEVRQEGEDYIGKLIASNGEALFNTQAYSSKSSLLSGIANIKERAASGNVTVCCDKQGRYQFKVYSDNGMVLVMGETYPSKDNAISAANSMRNFLAGEYKLVEAEEEKAAE